MSNRIFPIIPLAIVLFLGTTLPAQQHAHADAEKLGAVHFPTSCAPAVAARFDRAVAWLHSFEFREAIRGFEAVLASDSTCAMAWWGIAMSRWTNPMVPSLRTPAQLASGRAAADQAVRLAARASARERALAGAVAELFAESHADQRARVVAYEQAMQRVAMAYPHDSEAQVFHAIAIIGAALPTDKTYASQLKAGAILERMFERQPEHPGLAHYIIHGYDVPALADRAAAAARRYASIAPAAAHALHMPSHTFTRIGLWNESVLTNLRSRDAASRDGSIAEALHAADYAVYAYLQMRNDSAARAVLLEMPALEMRFDPKAVTGAAPGSAGVFALAAIPARYALERRAWAEAVALTPRSTDVPYADAVTHFARALAAARLGDTATIRASVAALESLHAKLVAARETYWTGQVDVQKLAADAWLEFVAGRRDSGIARMRMAAAREEATEKPAVSPGPLAPARELLGDMLLTAGRPAEAHVEYRAALTREPNRYWSLRGAADAARAAGDRAAEASYRAQLARLTRTG
jgi:carboxylesterase type B